MEEEYPATEKTKGKIATTYAHQRPAIQVALFVLWRIHNKYYRLGSRLFYEELATAAKATKGTYKESLAFLEGAGVVVNEVVVADKVPSVLLERYGIVKDD